MSKRLSKEVRKEEILNAALTLSERLGYLHITREQVANRAECSEASVTHYFTTMFKLKRAVVRAAIQRENLAVIAQALASRSPWVKKIDPDLRMKAIKSIIQE